MKDSQSQLLEHLAREFAGQVLTYKTKEFPVQRRKRQLEAVHIIIAPALQPEVDNELRFICKALRACGEIRHVRLKFVYWELESGRLEIEVLAESAFCEGERWLGQGSAFIPSGLWC